MDQMFFGRVKNQLISLFEYSHRSSYAYFFSFFFLLSLMFFILFCLISCMLRLHHLGT